MTIPDAAFAHPLLTADGERHLAHAIEAGVFADHLLGMGSSRHPAADLIAVRDRGQRAWNQLWLSNLRLVMQLAAQAARRSGLAAEDLFQDGCVGLAEAMLRFDHRRGLRFSTLAHQYVRRAVAISAASRGGRLDGPAHRHRVRSLLRQASGNALAEGVPEVSLRDLARTVGVGIDTAASSTVRFTPLEEAESALAVQDAGIERVERHGTAFLDLLNEGGEILRRRYGIGCPARTQSELADELGLSATTIARLESRALEVARRILSAETVRIPA